MIAGVEGVAIIHRVELNRLASVSQRTMSQFRDNTHLDRYEFDTPEGQSIADYIKAGDVRVITHVETPVEARGRGYAAQLMAEMVVHAREHEIKLRARCPYAVVYFRRHPDTSDVQA